MAEVKIKNIDVLKSNIKELFNEVRSNDQMLLDVGNETVRLTKGFLRSGKNPDGTVLPELSYSWEKRKQALTATNNPANYYKYGLSNLTFTGQLLDSMTVEKIDRKNASAIIGIPDTKRQPYKNFNNKPVKKTPTNKKIYEYLTKMGWKFFGINKQMENVINRIVRKYLNNEIKKRFNK